MSDHPSGNGATALESISRLADRRPSGDPLVEALRSIASELRELRVEVTSLSVSSIEGRKQLQFLRDDVRALTERTKHIPIIKDMLVEVLTRVPGE